jgi:hypothetical protein
MAEGIESVGTTLSLGSASLCLVSISGVSVDGGEKIETSCLSNTTWKTFLPQSLQEAQNLSFTAAYDPADYATLVAEINVNQSIVISFPSPLGGITFWGYLKAFAPAEAGIGERWTMTGEIVISCSNATNVETAPVYA